MTAVSIIMPVYNGERFIAQAIASVQTQTLRDWELIVVDDGSTDGTAAILDGYSDSNIRVLRQANQGEAVARNAGLAAARGQYVGFLDADDEYYPGALEALASYLQENPAVDVVYADGHFCDARGEPLMTLKEHRLGPYTGSLLEPLVISSSVIVALCSTLACRETIVKSGVQFDPQLRIGPDWDFWIHLARHARFGYLDQLACKYRIHDQNVTVTTRRRRRQQDLIAGRKKVLEADWFETLSARTRREFFYGLLVSLLHNDLEGQQEILRHQHFESLARAHRAELLRITASRYLLDGNYDVFSAQCLQQSFALEPGNLKTRLVLGLLQRRPGLLRLILRARSSLRQTVVMVGPERRRSRKPAPSALRDITD